MSTNIPLYRPYIGKEEIKAVGNVLRSRVLIRGNKVKKFEELFAKFVGKKYAIAVFSGTGGLHLAIKALNWGENDEIIITPYSYIASANVLLYEKIKPIFVDVDPHSFNLDPDEVIKKISPKTKGILLVHILGLPGSEKFQEIAKKYKLDILEDACETLHPHKNSFPVTNIGKATVYSFADNKLITTAQGGMIVTDDEKIAEYCRSARDQGRSNDPDWLNHVILGFNYKMSELEAAIGIEQLKKFNFIKEQKENIVKKYNIGLKNIKGISTPYENGQSKRSYFSYFIQTETKELKDKIVENLSQNSINTTKYFPCIHHFPQFKKLGFQKGDFPIAEHLSETVLALPFYIGIKDREINKIISIISNICCNYKKN
ncbi:DegT/DnrJ/EryC1/StrS family aminotransferase [Candidatus Beckwithbacteria bacterium]|nr:DegT/DnrJ/EryC1/StrS family aminotransferase [Candidatus Beckwithbacteria bacterium]